MRQAIIALVLLAIVVNGAMLPEIRMKARTNISKLAKSKFGKNLITAIQLEMTSNNQDNIVNRILDLLNELLNELTGTLTRTQDDLVAKEQSCNEAQEHWTNEIARLQGSINEAQQQIPIEQAAQAAFEQQLLTQNEAKTVAENALLAEDATNEAALALHAKIIFNNEQMIAGLEKARELIVQLQVVGLVQKSGTILAQLSDHRAETLNVLKNSEHKSLFNVLMQMAQDVGIQADQSKVILIIQIIDDLIAHHRQTIAEENSAEADRVEKYNNRRASLVNDINNATAEISRLEGEITHVQTVIAGLKADIEQWSKSLEAAKNTLEEVQNSCSVAIQNYHDQINELTDEIDVIKQVIDIFQSQTIQDIKPLVESLDYTE